MMYQLGLEDGMVVLVTHLTLLPKGAYAKFKIEGDDANNTQGQSKAM